MGRRPGSGLAEGGPHPIARPRIDPARTPFERTQAFRRFGMRIVPAAGEEHHYAGALIVEQGFDGLPHIVSAQELDAYVRTGEIELFRGISAARYAEQLRSGELYGGQGAYGGGIYAAGGPDGRDHAAEYAQDSGGVLVRMTIKVGARIGDTSELRRQMLRKRRTAEARGLRGRSAWPSIWAMTEDLSVYATYLGYVES
ncbi:MAG: hypothetical protein ACRDI2_20065 [Chloroflexota bacterium]